jgi:hypothetical protein
MDLADTLVYVWIILGMQTIIVGVSYMVEAALRKRRPKRSFLKTWWRTSISLGLWVIDCSLVGFIKGLTESL